MSDEPESESKLVERAEHLVAELELREPDWASFEERVNARLSSAASEDDDVLFAAPLPALDDEPTELEAAPSSTERTAAVRETVSLADLARASVAKRAGKEAADIAKESLALASQARAQHDRSAERRVVRAPDAKAKPAVAVPATAQARRPSGWDSRGPWIGVAIASVGLAASFGLYFAGQGRTTTIVTQPTVAIATDPGAPAPRPTELAPKAAPAGEGAPGLPKAPDLGERAAVAEREAESGAPAPNQAPAGKAERSAFPTAKPNGAAGKVAAERVVLDEERPGAPAQPTAAPKANELRPAELNPGGALGDRPSTGAAQAAVGAVLGAARSCIAGQTAPSSATLVFDSSGEVTSVRVSGPAAGTPAAGCVEAALKKARVQAFAAPSFSLSVTVRPL